jgi:filamin
MPESLVLNEESTFALADIQNLSDLKVKFESPSGREDIVPKIAKLSGGEYSVKWTPVELGAYTVSVLYANQLTADSPFRVKVFDPKRVKVTNMIDGFASKPSSFLVDASEAGEGSIEIGITCNGQLIPNQVKPVGYSNFDVQFVPNLAVTHMATVKFNGQPIVGSPFHIRITNPSNYK